MALLADGVPVSVFAGPPRAKDHPGAAWAAITARTKLFIINSPNNPTGAAYTKAELQAIGEVLAKHPQVVIASDEMYEHIYWARSPSPASPRPIPISTTAPSPSTGCPRPMP